MKPILTKILNNKTNDVYGFKVVDAEFFSTDFHFHEECQLVYNIESEGRLMIGDKIKNFGDDELTFVGSNLPHVWHNNAEYFSPSTPTPPARSITIYIHPEKILYYFREPDTIHKIKHFFHLGKSGIKFGSTTRKSIRNLIINMTNQQDEINRLICLLEIIKVVIEAKDYKLLCKPDYVNSYQLKDNNRMDKVLKYIFDNFNKEILLDEAAEMTNMNKQAFCRYFKNRTQKTFVTFVNEVRVDHACKLITETDQQISELAYLCGFNSLPFFNKFFKITKGVTPKEYKRMMTAS